MNERDLFIAALEKPTAEGRSEYLSIACAGDSTLRQRVEGLLQMHANTGEFLQKPLVERLAEGVAALEDSAKTGRDPSAPPGGSHGLGFLSPSEQPGSLGRLGHYEVQEVIGSGGMGIVLRAFDERLHRVVAIKVMAASLATNVASRKRFLREARAAAAVCHDHIVTIHAVEESGDLPYLVMQCVSGLSLQQRIDRDGPLELHEILRVGMQTAAGLAAAHAQGLIHRDIKPANILLENGVERVRITDFGLARAAADASISQIGIVAGTPQYMAPEQARGEALDCRTDLFSLGSVLYARCTGRAPFRAGNSIAVLKRVCEEAPSLIREANADIPDWLVELINKLHAKDPAERYQSAAEVADLLGQHLAQLQHPSLADVRLQIADCGLQVKPSSQSAISNPRSPIPRHRWTLAAAVLVLLGAGLGLTEATGVSHVMPTVIRIVTGEGVLVVQVDDPAVKVTIDGQDIVITEAGALEIRVRPGDHTIAATKDGRPVPVDQPLVTISRGGRQTVKVTRERPATVASQPAWTPPPPGVLDALDPAKIPADQRFDWQPKELVQVLGTHDGRQWNQPTVVAYSPDGKLAASGGYDGHIYVWDAATLRLRRMLPGHGLRVSIWGLAFFPDSRRLLSGGEENLVRVWDVETGLEIGQLKGHTGHVWGVAVSPDGLRVLTGAHDSTVRLWAIEGEKELHCFRGHTGTVVSVAISPDGSRALSGSADTTMRLWDLEKKTELYRFDGHTNDCRNVQFLHDGRRAISCSHDKTVRLWDLESRTEIRQFLGHTHNVYGVDVSHDGRRAVSTGMDGTIRVWNVDSGTELLQLKTPTATGFSSVALSPDEKRVLSGGHDGALRLWDLDRGTELDPGRVLPWHVNASRIAFSQDGRRVVTCINNHGFATVWDVASGRPLQTLKKAGKYVCAALSPDGRYVVCGGQWGLSVWSVETGEELRQFDGSAVAWDVAISRDGRTVLAGDHVGSDGSVRMWQFDSGRLMTPIGGHWGAVYAVALSADARRAVSGGWDKMFRLWDLESGDLLHQWQLSNHVWSVAISPDGRYAAASDDNGNIGLRDLSGSVPKILPLPKEHVGPLRAIAFSAGGRTLLSAGYDGRILLWDVGSGTVRGQWQLPGPIMAACYAPDGRHLATVNANGTVYILRLGQPASK